MNEFIKDKRCLVPYHRQQLQRLGTNYYVDPQKLAETIKNLLPYLASELKDIGNANREEDGKIKSLFHKRLKNLLLAYINAYDQPYTEAFVQMQENELEDGDLLLYDEPG